MTQSRVIPHCYMCEEIYWKQVPAVAFCRELNKPVCQGHADKCREDGYAVARYPDGNQNSEGRASA